MRRLNFAGIVSGLVMAATAMVMTPVCHAGKGMLVIITEPGDAKLYINGKRKGNSPAKAGLTFAIKLDEGEYKVEAIKLVDNGLAEYYGIKADIYVAGDTKQTLSLKLKKRETEAGRQVREKREKKEQLAREERKRKERLVQEERKRKKEAKLKAKYPHGIPEPKMVSIPGGSFKMGCVSGKDCQSDEKPVHTVNISAFEMSATEITFEQYDACVDFGGCAYSPKDKGWGRGNRPVIYVSWENVQHYIAWLNRKTGKSYRLPTEAEWEYAARAGSTTKYCWGNDIGKNKANCNECGSKWDYKKTAPVGSFQANGYGLYDMHGNVYEWVQDWHHQNYYKKSSANNPKGPNSGRCRAHRGGCWKSPARYLRSANRANCPPAGRGDDIGFRLVRQP